MSKEGKEMNLLPHLKPEIWDRVVCFVKQPRPIGCTPTKWKDLHQGDLASLMRVNSALNDIASRHLYHSVVTNDILCFTYGLDRTADLIRKSRTKLDLLGRVKRLFLEDSLWEMCGKSWSDVDEYNKKQWDDGGRLMTMANEAFLTQEVEEAAFNLVWQQQTAFQQLMAIEPPALLQLETIAFQTFGKLLIPRSKEADLGVDGMLAILDHGMEIRKWLETIPTLRVVCRQLAFGTMTDGERSDNTFERNAFNNRKRVASWHVYGPRQAEPHLLPFEPGMDRQLRLSKHICDDETTTELFENDLYVDKWLSIVNLIAEAREAARDNENDAEPDSAAVALDSDDSIALTTIIPYRTVQSQIPLTVAGYKKALVKAVDRGVGWLLQIMKSDASPYMQVMLDMATAPTLVNNYNDLLSADIDLRRDRIRTRSFLLAGECAACGGPGDVDEWMQAINGDMGVHRDIEATLRELEKEAEEGRRVKGTGDGVVKFSVEA